MEVKTKGEEYARIKYALKKKGKLVDEFDMVIAGQAISEGLIVVTDNLKHFDHPRFLAFCKYTACVWIMKISSQ